MKKQILISKFLSYILRHDPKAINSDLDGAGFLKIDLKELVQRMQELKQFNDITINESDIYEVVDKDTKGRYEIVNDKIRARYGHSIDGIRIFLHENEVPERLFHGTVEENLSKILKDGLKPMGRNLVHLTETIKDAISTGKRHGKKVIILEIDVKRAIKENINFWKPGKNVYTSLEIPAKYIIVYKE